MELTPEKINELGGEYKKAYDLGHSVGYVKGINQNGHRNEDKLLLELFKQATLVLEARLRED